MTNSQTLLADYIHSGSDAAFRELVTQYVDQVYSTALRLVDGDRHRAEDVAQTVFVDLARTARTLAGEVKLGGWLHRHTCFVAAKTMRGERRRQVRERQAVEMNGLQDNLNFSSVEPILDEAINKLEEADRTAILLRFYEQQDFHSVGAAIGATEAAARMRVTRALEKLQELLRRHGVTTTAGALSVALSANVVQAAPVGLAFTVSTAAVLAGPPFVTTTTAIAAKAVAMTTLQKTLLTTTLITAIGTGIYEARRASILQSQVQTLRQEQAAMAEQVQQLAQTRDDANNKLAMQAGDHEQLSRATAEVLRLRNELNLLQGSRSGPPQAADTSLPSDGTDRSASYTQGQIAAGRELGMAVVRGDAGAFEKMFELAEASHNDFKTNSIGLNDTQRGDLARLTFAPLSAAFEVIAEAATTGNSHALDAVVSSAQIAELKGKAIQIIGRLAATGDEAALETLLNPEKYGFLQSSVVGALKPAAENGNQRAINALAAVAEDPKQQALWYMAADGLSKAAESGNAVAIDALIELASSTNQSVQSTVLPPLQRAAANQNAKAAETLRSLPAQSP